MAVAAADVRAERTRILSTLLDRIEQIIDRALEAIRAEIPAYAAQDERFFADVREQVGAHYRTKLACLMEDHDVRLEDISFARGAAMRRARAGFALEDYINAFRVGQQVFWEALVEVAGESPSGHDAGARPRHAGHALRRLRVDARRPRVRRVPPASRGRRRPRAPRSARAPPGRRRAHARAAGRDGPRA